MEEKGVQPLECFQDVGAVKDKDVGIHNVPCGLVQVAETLYDHTAPFGAVGGGKEVQTVFDLVDQAEGGVDHTLRVLPNPLLPAALAVPGGLSACGLAGAEPFHLLWHGKKS